MTNSTRAKPTETRDVRPVPDPTVLTTDLIHREGLALRELVDTRFDAMERAIDLLQSNADKSPTIAEVYARTEEKFAGVSQRFELADVMAKALADATATAVTAALNAAKEAVAMQTQASERAGSKSEAMAMKQMEQFTMLLQATDKANSDKFADIKDRLSTQDARISASEGRGSGQEGSSLRFIAIIAAMIAAFAGMGTLLGVTYAIFHH